MPSLHRNREAIRDAMRRRGLSGPELSGLTKRVDPTGRGVSPAMIGRLTGQGSTARDAIRLRNAWLIALALGEPLQDLFSMPGLSTVTVERSTHGDEHAR